MRFGQGARPREPHDSRCACAGTKARHCSKTAGHLKLATTPEERSNLTTLNHLATIPKTTPSQHYRSLTSHYHPSTIKHIPHHVHCTSSHLWERLTPKPSLQTNSCELYQQLSHQQQHSTNRRNVQRTDIDQPPSSAVRPGDTL